MRYSLLVLIFLLPFQTRYFLVNRSIGGAFFEYGSFTVYATEILLWFLVFYQARARVYCKRSVQNSPPHERAHRRIVRFMRERPVIAWGALFFSYAALSFLWSINREQTLFYIIRFTEALLFIWLLASSRLSKRAFLLAFALGVVLQSALGVYQFFAQEVSGSAIFGIAPQIPETRGVAVVETELRRYLRAYGGLPHPNILGGWIVAGLIAVIALVYDSCLITRASLRLRVLPPILFAYALLFTGLILTFSRSAGLAFLVGGGLLFVYGVCKQGMRRGAVELLAITALISLFLGVLLREPLTERGKGLVFNRDAGRLERKSADERGMGLHDGWILYKKNPLIGGGLGTYTTALASEYPDRPLHAIQPAHSVPVLIAGELGIIGIFFALALVYHIAAFFFRRRHAHVMGIALFFAFGIIGIFDHYLLTLYSGVLLAGFCFCIASRQ